MADHAEVVVVAHPLERREIDRLPARQQAAAEVPGKRRRQQHEEHDVDEEGPQAKGEQRQRTRHRERLPSDREPTAPQHPTDDHREQHAPEAAPQETAAPDERHEPGDRDRSAHRRHDHADGH
ncbi:MAG: hypothetical protein ACK56F_14420, partial [bacterium]